MTCDGHEPHDYEPGDCEACGHPKSEHPDGRWDNRPYADADRDDDAPAEPLPEPLP